MSSLEATYEPLSLAVAISISQIIIFAVTIAWMVFLQLTGLVTIDKHIIQTSLLFIGWTTFTSGFHLR